jgi:hypothetical protein
MEVPNGASDGTIYELENTLVLVGCKVLRRFLFTLNFDWESISIIHKGIIWGIPVSGIV